MTKHFHESCYFVGSMLDLIGGGSQQSASRSGTPAVGHRKSPTADQGTQVSCIFCFIYKNML